MDFSAKQLKKTLTENQQSVKSIAAVKTKPAIAHKKIQGNAQSKEAKAFIKSNTAQMYKSALAERTYCRLESVDYISKWWDNVDIIQSLNDRGFTIVDDDPKHFGTWYSSIALLEANEVSELEEFLINRVSNVSRSRPKAAIQKILKTYLHSNDSRINILRLLLLLNKLQLEDDFYINDTFVFVNKILPLNLGTYYVNMDGKTENFFISWRYPNQSVNCVDGVTASNLSWLCSKTGNNQFRKLHEAIKKNFTHGDVNIQSKIDTDDQGFIVFLDKYLKDIALELSPLHLKHLLETLEYVVSIEKGQTLHVFTIGLQ